MQAGRRTWSALVNYLYTRCGVEGTLMDKLCPYYFVIFYPYCYLNYVTNGIGSLAFSKDIK